METWHSETFGREYRKPHGLWDALVLIFTGWWPNGAGGGWWERGKRG